MKNKSSNETMNDPLALLQSIQKIDPPAALADKIMQKVVQQKVNFQKVSLTYVGIAASLFIGIICIEGYLMYQTNTQRKNKAMVELVGQTQNNLYHE